MFHGLIDFGDAHQSHPALDLRVWPSLDDSRRFLSGYSRQGPLAEGFEAVRPCGIILTQLREVSRESSELRAASRSIQGLLDDT